MNDKHVLLAKGDTHTHTPFLLNLSKHATMSQLFLAFAQILSGGIATFPKAST